MELIHALIVGTTALMLAQFSAYVIAQWRSGRQDEPYVKRPARYVARLDFAAS